MSYSSAKLFSDIHFSAHGLVAIITQDIETGDVLMFAYANEEALKKTIETGYAHYFSRSRGKLWKKGEESGHLQKIVDILVDCDADAILYRVKQEGCACHEGYRSCFFRDLDGNTVLPRIKDPAKIYK